MIKNKVDVFVVNDASADERFAHYPCVIGPPNIRFYAGVPLIDEERDTTIGTFCIMSPTPRERGLKLS
jgi:GAF domain-containing protein